MMFATEQSALLLNSRIGFSIPNNSKKRFQKGFELPFELVDTRIRLFTENQLESPLFIKWWDE